MEAGIREGITHKYRLVHRYRHTEPIEQEGTYPLPEAQMDRFLMKMSMEYPDRAEESHPHDENCGDKTSTLSTVTSPKVVAMQKR